MVWCGCERLAELCSQSRFAGALDARDAEEERGSGGGGGGGVRASAVPLEEGQEEGYDGGGFVVDDG